VPKVLFFTVAGRHIGRPHRAAPTIPTSHFLTLSPSHLPIFPSKGNPEGQIEPDFCEIHLVKANENAYVGRIKELQQSISGFDVIWS
jgi:hypothetical protein